MHTAGLVLVVDDDAVMLRSVARLLRQFGYASLLFSSTAFENHSDFGAAVCVILDINLDRASGIEVRLRLKAAGNSVPVIYITRNDTSVVREAVLRSGCLAYLTKPLSARSLIEMLKIASAASATQSLSGTPTRLPRLLSGTKRTSGPVLVRCPLSGVKRTS
jgi:FixJ family two-component response regulator